VEDPVEKIRRQLEEERKEKERKQAEFGGDPWWEVIEQAPPQCKTGSADVNTRLFQAVYKDDLATVQELIKDPGVNPNFAVPWSCELRKELYQANYGMMHDDPKRFLTPMHVAMYNWYSYTDNREQIFVALVKLGGLPWLCHKVIIHVCMRCALMLKAGL
jgi:hypothetical protein